MSCSNNIDYNLLSSILALVVAIIALFVGYRAIRYQIISLINAQLADKAKDCNTNLDSNNYGDAPKQLDKISGILSSIITAEELLNYQVNLKKNIFILHLDVQSLIDQFYLQLHTTIRLFLQKEKLEISDIDSSAENILVVLQVQYNKSQEFLSISIKKDNNKVFEQLHSFSLERNKKANV
ncbi:hypothetical protein ACPPVU_01610 [Mucilaginibacter sp. McL0603]|uniref:hypothetical protein n=1 Tax=Mucilaginibacter sp. McL0603 TaxID=3415670 RepID=UPI003CF9040E